MGTGCILAGAGSHPLQMLLKLVQWWLLIHPVIHCCAGSTCVQMASDSTPKYHSSPCYMLLNECREDIPIRNEVHLPSESSLQVLHAHQSEYREQCHQAISQLMISTARWNVLLRMQKEEPWWLLHLEKCQDMVNSLWDTAINGCRNHKQDQALEKQVPFSS